MFGQRLSCPFGLGRFPVWRGCSNVTMRNNPLIAVDVHNVIGCQVLHVHEGQCCDEYLTVCQMLVVLDNLCLDVLAMQASPSSPSGQGHGLTARLPCSVLWHSSLLCKANKFERPFASHRANGMLFLQLNWLWVPLIVTLPITGTMPFFSLPLFT